jgi:hypothetical protein
LFLDPSVFSVIVVASYASYLLGVVLRTLPNRRLHRIGLMCIFDAGVNIIFLAIYSMIPVVMGFALTALTGQPISDPSNVMTGLYNRFDCWLGIFTQGCSSSSNFTQSVLQSYDLAIKTYSLYASWPVVGKAVSSLWSSFFAPTLDILSGMIMFLTILHFLGLFLQAAWVSLTTIGAVLYGLPGRLGRSVGAGLIATMIVYTVGLPFMPAFVGAFCAALPHSQGSANGHDCAKPPDLGPFQAAINNANQTAAIDIISPLLLLIYPNVRTQVSSTPAFGWPAQPLGGSLVTVANSSGASWSYWTLPNGTRYFGLPPGGSYTVEKFEYQNVTLPYTVVVGGPSFVAPPIHQGTVEVDLSVNVLPFTVSFRTSPVRAISIPAFFDLEGWSGVSLQSFTMRQLFQTVYIYIFVTAYNFDSVFRVFFARVGGLTFTVDGVSTTQFTEQVVGTGAMYTFPLQGNETAPVQHQIEFQMDTGNYAPPKQNVLADLNPTLATIPETGTQLSTYISASATLILDFTTALMLQALILPALYLLILAVIADDIASALGGKGLTIILGI